MVERPIAFLILAHADPTHLERLCRALSPHSVFVHLDGGTKNFPVEKIAALPGVTLVKPSVRVHWGDFSMIEATHALLHKARDTGVFDRYVLLSGACYPIKPMASLVAAFREEPRREWINLTRIHPDSRLTQMIGRRWRMAPFVRLQALDEHLRSLWNEVTKTKGRDFEREIQMPPYFGSQWWALTDDCVTMIMDFYRSNPAFLEAYRSVYAPDEQFFHTIVGNSRFNGFANHVEDRGTFTNQVTPLHLISAAEDRYWRSDEEDFARIEATSQFFIRKVSADYSAALLDRIDAELLHAKEDE